MMFALAADLLTLSRLFAAAGLIWLGLQGPETLTGAIVLSVVAWTTDQLDGWAARRATTPTRLAPADFAIDRVLYAATLAYLVLSGFVPAIVAVAYGALAVSISLIYRRKAIDVLSVRLIDLMSATVIFRHRPLIGFALLGWLLVLTVLYRQRVAERVPRWFAEVGELVGLRSRKRHTVMASKDRGLEEDEV